MPPGVRLEMPPKRFSCCRRLLEMPAPDTLVEMRPTISAKKPLPSSQPAKLASSLRRASAAVEDSPKCRGATSSLLAKTPVPRSRPSQMRAAPATSTSVASAGASSTAGRGPANARISSLHPSGESQRTHCRPADVSATTRAMSAIRSAPKASSSATRRVGASWLASAPTPRKTAAGVTTHSARYADPPAGRRAASRPKGSAAHSAATPRPQDASTAR